jgi:WhiB family redox-sensing transcriptional regulator
MININNYPAMFSATGDCTNYDPEWWFPEEKPGRVSWSRTYAANTARNICKECPIRKECLDYAVQFHGITGIWGGTDRHERSAMQKALNIVPISWERSFPSPLGTN